MGMQTSKDLENNNGNCSSNEATKPLQSNNEETHFENIPMNKIDSTLDGRRTAGNEMKKYLKAKDKHGFIAEYEKQYNRPLQADRASDLSRFMQSLDDDCLSRAVGYWKEEGIFAIHDLLRNVDILDGQDRLDRKNELDGKDGLNGKDGLDGKNGLNGKDGLDGNDGLNGKDGLDGKDERVAIGFLKFLKDKPNLSVDYGKDTHKRTWLHAAVCIDCNTDIIKFVKENLNVSSDCQDDIGNTVLHDFCMHTTDGYANDNKVKDIISLLIGGNMDLLLIENENGRTPLEIACGRKFVFNALMKSVKLDDLLKHVDLLGNSFNGIEKVEVLPEQKVASFWIDIFRKNDNSKLLAYMKDVEGFNKMYLMEDERTFKGTFTKCAEDIGLRNEITENIKRITNRNEELSEYFRFAGVRNSRFYKSAPFLALLTGRWDLVMPLVAFSPFEVVPFSLLTCTVCDKMKKWENISDTVDHELSKLHKTADAYLTEIIKVMYQQYPRNADRDVVYEYLTKPTNFFEKSLMDVSYFANSRKLFNSLVCRTITKRLWKEGHDQYLSYFCKFVVHSLFHIVFLLCLFVVLLKDRRNRIGGVEIFCYLYGVGYFAEEVRQMLYYRRIECLSHYFRDATNIVDLIGLASLLVAFGCRCSISFSSNSHMHMEWQVKIAFIGYLFLSLTSISLSLRLLYFLSFVEKFGPKLEMIERMIFCDLLPVVVIFFVFILSFGVAFESLIFSGVSNQTISTERNSSSTFESFVTRIADILWRPTFTIFEPKYVIEMAEKSNSPSINNPLMKLIVHSLLIMFIIIVSVMLMNMLIALFSQTVSDTNTKAKESWAIDRWKYIREDIEKSYLVPPFNIIEIFVVLIKQFCRIHKSAKSKDAETVDVHPFTILLFLKINRFNLLDNVKTQGMSDDTTMIMDFLQSKIAKLEDMLNKQSNDQRREIH